MTSRSASALTAGDPGAGVSGTRRIASMRSILARSRASSHGTTLAYPVPMHVVLAHGASGSSASLAAHVTGLALRGITATAIDLPLRQAEKAVPAYAAALEEVAVAPAPVIGGQSYGGRVASLLAADDPARCSGLVLLSYPLHRPGRPEWQPRTQHWERITAPVLLLSGASDPFARLDLLRRAVAERLPRAELGTYPRLGHTLTPVLEEVLDRIALFVAGLHTGRSAS
jgi:uncharacterized protein